MTEVAVNLIITCLFRDENLLQTALQECCLRWGDIDYHSKSFPFDITDYYTPEMGAGLQRVFVSFKKLLHPEEMVLIKHECERIETKVSLEGKRRVNIDPGYIDTNKYVLMSYKFGGQKIYIADSVWADMTLMYKKGRWLSFDWTFPDFKDARYHSELNKIRELYKIKCKNTEKYC